MKKSKGAVFLWLIVLGAIAVLVWNWIEAGDNSWIGQCLHLQGNNRAYITYEEHLAKVEKEKRNSDLKKKLSDTFQHIFKKS